MEKIYKLSVSLYQKRNRYDLALHNALKELDNVYIKATSPSFYKVLERELREVFLSCENGSARDQFDTEVVMVGGAPYINIIGARTREKIALLKFAQPVQCVEIEELTLKMRKCRTKK